MPAYEKITDLPDDWARLRSSHIEGLLAIWRERHEKMKDSPALAEFNARLQREWAIETGIIEGLYTLDRGTTQLLIERGIIEDYVSRDATNRPVPQVIALLRDHENVLEGVFDFIAGKRELSTSYIKEVHAELTRHQDTVMVRDMFGQLSERPLKRGEWKDHPNNPQRPDGILHEYCPPEHVAAEMDRLIEMHRQHTEQGVPPEVESAWLHHRFTQIHPFQDGNGRVARILASLIFLRAGGFPVTVHRDRRADYITALENADDGVLKSLIELFGEIQEKAITQAINVADAPRNVDTALAAVIERIHTRSADNGVLPSVVFSIAQILSEESYKRLGDIQTSLHEAAYEVNRSYGRSIQVHLGFANKEEYLTEFAVMAYDRGYFADIDTLSITQRLRWNEGDKRIDFVIGFHSYSEEFLGIVAVAAFIDFMRVEESSRAVALKYYPVFDKPFIFNYQESLDELKKRFSDWLDKVIIVGLDQWRRLL